MDFYKKYAAFNERLMLGDKLFMDRSAKGCRVGGRQTGDSRPVNFPRIGIYAGEGASHSWLWFVDMFDRMGFHDLVFLDATAIQREALAGIDVLAVSGGDTFAVAKALGPAGAGSLFKFISAGGMYIGSCAGAYLVMNSSKPGLNDFNFSAVKITNLSKALPNCRLLPHKFAMSYGCDYIFHPVREAVRLKTTVHSPCGVQGEFQAPLYGGPAMIAPDEAQVLATYEGFSPKTVFLVDEKFAYETLVGKAAALRSALGKGCLYLCGPHFEHPRFPAANAFLAEAIYWDNQYPAARQQTADCDLPLSEAESRSLLKDIKREVSNARISASSIELRPVRWLIGAKYYEPEKIMVFLQALWRRLTYLEKRGFLKATAERSSLLRRYAKETTALMRQLKQQVDQACDTCGAAENLFGLLQRFAITFLEMYFQTARTHI